MKCVLIFLALILSGCANMHVTVKAASDVNRDDHDVPQSVAVHVFQLKNIAAFNAAQLIPLFDNPSGVLGGDMLSDHELFVQPGQHQAFSEALLPGAQFIGFVAAFKRHQSIPWRRYALIKTANHYANERLDIELGASGLVVA